MRLFKEPKLLILHGGLGAVALAGALVLGSGLTLATGIPIMSAIANGVFVCFVLTIGASISRAFGSVTLMMFVYGLFATFSVLLGPPGLQKIPVAIAMGLAWDVLVFGLGHRWWTHTLSAIAFMLIGVYGVYATMVIIGLPAAEKLAKALPFISTVSAVSGAVGALLGWSSYATKIKNLHAAQLFMPDEPSPEAEVTEGAEEGQES